MFQKALKQRASNRDPMLRDHHLPVLMRLADCAIPPDRRFPGASSTGFAVFFTDLLRGDRHTEYHRWVEFLDRCSGRPDLDCSKDKDFPDFAEMVHEHYWTSTTGLAACGFETVCTDGDR